MHQKTHFISDLHIFCRRFDGERFWNQTLEAAGKARTLVPGGDTLDFRWTTVATIEEAADAAIRRLELLVANHRECAFHYLLGNYDQHEAFLVRISIWSGALPAAETPHYSQLVHYYRRVNEFY